MSLAVGEGGSVHVERADGRTVTVEVGSTSEDEAVVAEITAVVAEITAVVGGALETGPSRFLLAQCSTDSDTESCTNIVGRCSGAGLVTVTSSMDLLSPTAKVWCKENHFACLA